MIFNVGTSVFFKVVLPLNRAPGAEISAITWKRGALK